MEASASSSQPGLVSQALFPYSGYQALTPTMWRREQRGKKTEGTSVVKGTLTTECCAGIMLQQARHVQLTSPQHHPSPSHSSLLTPHPSTPAITSPHTAPTSAKERRLKRIPVPIKYPQLPILTLPHSIAVFPTHSPTPRPCYTYKTTNNPKPSRKKKGGKKGNTKKMKKNGPRGNRGPVKRCSVENIGSR